MELWIPFTIAAAFFQNLRSALQKHLSGKLSTLGAAYVRFVFALPVAVLYFFALLYFLEESTPAINSKFLTFALLGGICQIMFTAFLLWLFSFHNFAVGTTISKLETIMVALFGLVLLGDRITATAAVAIAVSAVGLIVLSSGQAKLSLQNLLAGLWRLPTVIGLSCAAWLGASVVFFRGASLSLQSDHYLISSSFTLMVVLILQIVVMGAYLLIKQRSEFAKIARHWRPASLVGLSGGLASIGWFAAFTLQNATYVRALGQIELLFTFVATIFIFKERVTRIELIGMALICASILLLLLGT